MLINSRIPPTYIVRQVGREAVIVFVIAASVEALLRYNQHFVPRVGVALPSFLGTAISLILSFKLSQSYDRWWEARKVWGAIVNDSRSLVRQLLSFTTSEPDLVRQVARRQIAWCYALGQSLRDLPWQDRTEPYLSENDAAAAGRHANKPLALLQQHARDLAQLAAAGALTDYQRVTVDDTLRRLTDWMGMAERIRSTVFPTTYRVFLHAFIYLFITLLSIALGEIEGAWQVLVTTVISIPFFLLERTAMHLQDPFSARPTDTPVTAIARTIEINILQLLGEQPVPEPTQPAGFYLM